jgi:hypothetical protein
MSIDFYLVLAWAYVQHESLSHPQCLILTWWNLWFYLLYPQLDYNHQELKPKQDRSPRGIVAKFERRKDRNKVLSKAIAKLKNNKQFIVHEQYPIEIIDRRRLYVVLLNKVSHYSCRVSMGVVTLESVLWFSIWTGGSV